MNDHGPVGPNDRDRFVPAVSEVTCRMDVQNGRYEIKHLGITASNDGPPIDSAEAWPNTHLDRPNAPIGG